MNAALHVAHGTGLGVPLHPVPHDVRRRESSAPPFLRRDPALLAQLDANKPVAPDRSGGKNPRPAKLRAVNDRTNYGGPRASIVSRMKFTTKDDICQRYQDGGSIIGVGKELGYSQHVIRAILTERGIPFRPPYNHGTSAPLTDAQVAEAARLYADGATLRQLGKRYRTSKDKVGAKLRDIGVTIRPSKFEKARL